MHPSAPSAFPAGHAAASRSASSPRPLQDPPLPPVSSAPDPQRCTPLFLPSRGTPRPSSHPPAALRRSPRTPPSPPRPRRSATHQRVPFAFPVADDRHGAHHVLGGRGAAGPSRHGHGQPGKAQLHGTARARAAAPGAPHRAAGRGTAPRGGPDPAAPRPTARLKPPRRPEAAPRPSPARAVRPPSLVSAKGGGSGAIGRGGCRSEGRRAERRGGGAKSGIGRGEEGGGRRERCGRGLGVPRGAPCPGCGAKGSGGVWGRAPASTRRQPRVPSGLTFIGAFRLRPYRHHRSATPPALTLRPICAFPRPGSADAAARSPAGRAGTATCPQREGGHSLPNALPPAPFHTLQLLGSAQAQPRCPRLHRAACC